MPFVKRALELWTTSSQFLRPGRRAGLAGQVRVSRPPPPPISSRAFFSSAVGSFSSFSSPVESSTGEPTFPFPAFGMVFVSFSNATASSSITSAFTSTARSTRRINASIRSPISSCTLAGARTSSLPLSRSISCGPSLPGFNSPSVTVSRISLMTASVSAIPLAFPLPPRSGCRLYTFVTSVLSSGFFGSGCAAAGIANANSATIARRFRTTIHPHVLGNDPPSTERPRRDCVGNLPASRRLP